MGRGSDMGRGRDRHGELELKLFIVSNTWGVCTRGGAINSLTVVVTFHLEKVCQSCTLVRGGGGEQQSKGQS